MAEQPEAERQEPTKQQAKKMGKQQMMRNYATGARKQQKQDNKDHDLINPEQAKKRIKNALTAAEIKYKQLDNGQVIKTMKPNWEEALVKKEKGVKTIMSVVEGCISQAAAGGYTNRQDEFKAGFYTLSSLAKKIHKNKDELGIESWEDASLILDIIAYNVKITLTKARGGRAMKHGETIRDVREFIDEGEDQSKRSSRSSSWMPF